MLANIRSFAKSPYAIVLIGLIILSFAVFGVGGIFTGSGTAVVVIGKEQVSARELSLAYEREIQNIQLQDSSFTQERARQQGLGDRVLQNLITQSTFLAKAGEMGLVVSGDSLFEEISNYEAFQNMATGQYDYDAMQQTLAQNRTTEAQFQDSLTDSLVYGQIINTLASGVTGPEVLAETRYLVMQEQRRMRALILDPSTADSIDDPTDEMLQELIDNTPNATDSNGLPVFTAPEYRAITLVRFQLDDFLQDVEIDENILRETYDYQLDTGAIGTPAYRSLVQLYAGDEATAQAATERLAAGESGAAIAADLGLSAPLPQNDVQAYQIPDTTLADTVFSMANGTSLAIEGDFGWYAVLITAATDANTPSFEELLPDLREQNGRAVAQDNMYEAMSNFETLRGDGATMEEAARDSGVPVEIYAPLDQFARDQSGVIDFARYQSLGPDILVAAFDQITGFEVDVDQYNETDFFTVRVDEVIPSRPRRLDEVRDVAEVQWRDIQVNIQLSARMDEALAQLQAGEDMELVSLMTGSRVETATLKRSDTAGPFNRNVVSQAFRQSVGEFAQVPQSDGTQHVILVVDEIIPGNLELAGLGEMDNAQSVISQEMSNDVLISAQLALQEEYNVAEANIDLRLRALALGENIDQQQ